MNFPSVYQNTMSYEMADTFGYAYDDSDFSESIMRFRTAETTVTPQEISANTAERKLVKRANLRIRVEKLDTADSTVNGIMETHGAYASSTVLEEYSCFYTIRVPSAAYNAFLAEIAAIGRMLHRSENTEDVTLHYYDLEGRLATQSELLRTFQSYLGRAGNIDDILSVERRIAELQREIDLTGRDIRDIANDIEFSTVELTVLGPVAVSAQFQGATLGERIIKLFQDFRYFLSGLAVVFIGIIVYGIPILILLIFIIWILFGRIGLMKKLWRIAVGNNQRNNT